MAICDVCGNDYDKAFKITQAGKTLTFDSFECAIQAMAPRCAHCQCHVIGHGVEAGIRDIAAHAGVIEEEESLRAVDEVRDIERAAGGDAEAMLGVSRLVDRLPAHRVGRAIQGRIAQRVKHVPFDLILLFGGAETGDAIGGVLFLGHRAVSAHRNTSNTSRSANNC